MPSGIEWRCKAVKYSEKDLISDMSYFNGNDDKMQKKYKYNEIGEITDEKIYFSGYESQILDLNTVIRVDNFLRTPYSIHMSYPSARSLYTLRLYFFKDGYLLTKDFWKRKEVLKAKSSICVDSNISNGDIIIELKEFNDNHYPSIFKTLQILEVGHLLYNISLIADIYGYEYELDNDSINILVLKNKKAGNNYLENNKTIEFWEKAQNRSSGKYYGGLINFDLDYQKYAYSPKGTDETKSIKFNKNIMNSVKTLTFVNDGNALVDKNNGLVLYYGYIMKEYNYLNARTMSQITAFLYKWEKGMFVNYAELIQYIGFLAQEVCINNSAVNVYNRPVKQMNFNFWLPIMKQNDIYEEYIPFYGILTGKESESASTQRKII